MPTLRCGVVHTPHETLSNVTWFHSFSLSIYLKLYYIILYCIIDIIDIEHFLNDINTLLEVYVYIYTTVYHPVSEPTLRFIK